MSSYSKGHLQKRFNSLPGRMTQGFSVVETILRNRARFFNDIRDGIGVQQKITAMIISAIVFLAAYGAVLGSTHSLLQMLSSAVKLPFLFLATAVICIPTLYVFNTLFGSTQRLNQSFALILTGVTVMAVLLLSLAPIAFFFMLTASGYQFFKLLNVTFLAVSAIIGMVFFLQGMQVISAAEESGSKRRNFILYTLWSVLYFFVGSQMAWTLRPFFGYPAAKFELIREVGGSFYTDIFYSLGELLGFLVVM